MEVLGVPTPKQLCRCSRKLFFFNADNTPIARTNREGVASKPGKKSLQSLIQTENREFLDFLGKCLTLDPERRMKPFEALMHSWIIKGIPANLRQDHIKRILQDIHNRTHLEQFNKLLYKCTL